MLGEDVVFEDGGLGAAGAVADDHLAFDGFASGEEFGLADDLDAVASALRPSRRRWRLASSRVEPETPRTSSLELFLGACGP
ncbi:hypothetical protein GCM10029992_24020 [Glycomyces albus]